MKRNGKAASPRRLPAEERRAQIVAASRPVFMRSGLAGTRVRDLAAAAGVNEALLYHYFAGKEELFEAAIAQPLEAAVEATVSRAVPAFDASGEVMREHTETFICHLLAVMRDVAPLLGLMLFGEQEDSQRYWLESLGPALERIREVARRNLSVWSHRDFEPDLVVDTIFGTAFFLAIEDRFRTAEPRDLDRTARNLCNVLFDGMASHTGPEAGAV